MADSDDTYVVVDGSNIATEGRSSPSLEQLDEAVQAFMVEHPHDTLTVVVDATFAHRIDSSEKDTYEAAIENGEIVTPPAGAIGRGDAFVLEIADRAGATVLSNDSFQEFHGEYTWLFDEGRLIGGKPVKGLGWVFVARSPVRGPTSRRAVRDAKGDSGRKGDAGGGSGRNAGRDRGGPQKQSRGPAPEKGQEKAQEKGREKGQEKGQRDGRRRGGQGEKKGQEQGRGRNRKATDRTDNDRTEKDRTDRDKGGSRSRGGDASRSEEARESASASFRSFVESHPIGSRVTGTVATFASHGAYVDVEGVRSYAPIGGLGNPAPRSAKDVLELESDQEFVVDGIDWGREGLDLALAGFESSEARAAGAAATPTPASGGGDDEPKAKRRPWRRRRR